MSTKDDFNDYLKKHILKYAIRKVKNIQFLCNQNIKIEFDDQSVVYEKIPSTIFTCLSLWEGNSIVPRKINAHEILSDPYCVCSASWESWIDLRLLGACSGDHILIRNLVIICSPK
jgi:hypothetical protein